jgi:hypothetical protein
MNVINPNPTEVREFAKHAPSGPVAMLNLMRLKPGLELEPFLQGLAIKNAPYVELVKGETIYAAQGSHDFLGGDDWDLVILFRYAAFSDFVSIVCNEEWRKSVGSYREEWLEEAKLILTIPFSAS